MRRGSWGGQQFAFWLTKLESRTESSGLRLTSQSTAIDANTSLPRELPSVAELDAVVTACRDLIATRFVDEDDRGTVLCGAPAETDASHAQWVTLRDVLPHYWIKPFREQAPAWFE